MKYFLNGLFFLVCFFSSFNLSATDVSDCPHDYQAKLYFALNDLEIADNVMYIHLENNLCKVNTIRTDQQGFYIFGNDITNCEISGQEEKWKCPYCHYWWPIEQKCQNKVCPTNKW